jgi:hypothetical protein
MRFIFFFSLLFSGQYAFSTTITLQTIYTCKQTFDGVTYSIGLTEDGEPNYYSAYVTRSMNEENVDGNSTETKNQMLIMRKVSKNQSSSEGFFVDDEGRISLYIKATDFFDKATWGNALISLPNGNEFFLEVLKCFKNSEISFSSKKVRLH